MAEITEEVVHNELNEVAAFRVVLNTFVEKNPLNQKLAVNDFLKSATDLVSFASLLRNRLDDFHTTYGVHLVCYATLEEIDKLLAKCILSRQLLGLKRELETGLEPRSPSPIDASSVAQFVCEEKIKCSSCEKKFQPTDRKSQLTCRTIDVKKRHRQKEK